MKSWLVAILMMISTTLSMAQRAEDFEQVMSNIRQKELSEDLNEVLDQDSDVTRLLADIKSDGSWSDIPYQSRAQTGWPPQAHLDRVLAMSQAYVNPRSAHYASEGLYKSIERALSFWHETDPRSTNWFFQQVRSPQIVGRILIIMRGGKERLPSELETKMLARIRKIGGRPDQSGSLGSAANKIYIATQWFYRGCLEADAEVVRFAISQILEPVKFTTDEGLQHDYSYLQHGPQLHIGGYGSVFIGNVLSVMKHLNGTAFEPNSDQTQLLFDYATNTYLPLIRGRYLHYNVLGRGVAKMGALSAKSQTTMVELLRSIDKKNSRTYDASLKRISGKEDASYKVATEHRHYWRSDFTRYSSPDYAFDVRMVSSRTKRNENGNKDNLKGYFLADGANAILVDGDEYFDIFGVWDWSMIPGTTTPHYPIDSIPLPPQWGTYGTTQFVGGVSDGEFGISVYDYNDTQHGVDTRARKSWFCLGREVVCLGAGINSTNPRKIVTTLNQTLSKGDITISSEGDITDLAIGSQLTASDIDWVHHNKVGYYLPNRGNLTVSNRERNGDWHTITAIAYAKGKLDTADVFALSLDHGHHPIDAEYSYIIVPNISAKRFARYDFSQIEIAQNDAAQQVVIEHRHDRYYFVFYEAGEYSDDRIRVSVDEPCAFMLSDISAKSFTATIASPGHTSSAIKIEGEFKELDKSWDIACNLPLGTEHAGESVTITQSYKR